jgi:hypothetical protein
LDKEGKPGPQAGVGVFERMERPRQQRDYGDHTTPVALRDRCRSATAVAARHVPFSAEEGSFTFLLRDRN